MATNTTYKEPIMAVNKLKPKVEFKDLPFELQELILKILPPEDLWTCLSVCREWRMIVDSEGNWKRICLKRNMDINYFDDGDTKDLSLCKYALIWKCCSDTYERWRTNTSYLRHIPFEVSEDLTCTRFFVYKKKLALISNKIQLYSFTKKSYTVENINLPFVPHKVTMNNIYLVCSYGNLVMVHKKKNTFQIFCVLLLSEDSTLQVRTDKIKNILDNKQKFGPYIQAEALVSDYLWVSCLKAETQYLHIVNLKNLTIKNTDIVSRLLSVTRQKVIVSTAKDIQIFNFKGDLQYKFNFQSLFRATDDYIVTFPRQGDEVKVWSINGTYIQTLSGLSMFRLDHTRHLIYSCQRENEKDCRLSAISLKTGIQKWGTILCDVKLSEIDDIFLVCDKFLIVDVYVDTPAPAFHFGLIFDLDNKSLLYKAYLKGYTMFVSNHLWVQKRQNDLLVNIY